MCDKCKRIADPQKDLFAWMRTGEPGKANEFVLVRGAKFCPTCGGRLTHPREFICKEVTET